MLSPQHREIVPFRNGDVITHDYSKVGDKCYANPTGTLVDKSKCDSASNYAKQALVLSDKVVYSDLLRFYTPNGFEPVDRNKINYTMDQTKDLISPTPTSGSSNSTIKNTNLPSSKK